MEQNPFTKQLKTIIKQKSIANWRMKLDKSQNNSVKIEYWEAGTGNQVGKGIVGGAKMSSEAKFGKHIIIAKHICYHQETDSWLVLTKEGTSYRIAWPNAYQNENYDMHKSRDDVNAIIKSCTGTKTWEL